MQHHQVQRWFEELKERVALQNKIGGLTVRLGFNMTHGIAQQRHAFGEKALLGPQPKRFSRASGQESGAVGSCVSTLLPTDRVDVLVGSAVAVLAVLRADSVTVLRDFTGDPLGFRKRSNDVAGKLRLANAAGVPADDDNSIVGFGRGHECWVPSLLCALCEL